MQRRYSRHFKDHIRGGGGGGIIHSKIVHGWFNKDTITIDPWYGVVLSMYNVGIHNIYFFF